MFPQIKNPQAWRRRGQFKEKLGEDNLSCHPTSRQLLKEVVNGVQ